MAPHRVLWHVPDMRVAGPLPVRERAPTVAECVDAPRHAGPLESAVRVGEARADGRIVRIGLFAGRRARFQATSCASLIAYAEVACEAIEAGGHAEAADPDALRALLAGVHPSHLERAALVAAAVRAAFAPEEP